MAREAEEARAELRESCQAILQQRAWGIAHDFSDGTCYEPVAMA